MLMLTEKWEKKSNLSQNAGVFRLEKSRVGAARKVEKFGETHE